MIILENKKYRYYRRGKDRVYYLAEILFCPECGRRLYIHGNCKRRFRVAANEGDQSIFYFLVVTECRSCHRTHRVLPDELVPYKRYPVVEYARRAKDRARAGDAAYYKVLSWLRALFWYGEEMEAMKRMIQRASLRELSGAIRRAVFPGQNAAGARIAFNWYIKET